MRRFRDIVEDIKAPSPQSLWLDKGKLKFFGTKGWASMVGEENGDRQELEEKVDNLDKEVGDIQKDVAVLNSKAIIELEIGNSESVKANNLAKLQAIQSVDHLFFADIDYGYGAAKWLPTTGGEAFIVTSSGRAVIYNIGKDGSVAKASTDIDLTNPNTDLFEVVTELPTENISTSKLYCVLSSTAGEENKYTEYAYIKQTDGQFAWEKMGEFNAAPDLSGYAKLSGATFTGEANFNAVININRGYRLSGTLLRGSAGFIKVSGNSDARKVFSSDGKLADIGTVESFVFTLEDGSKVTKSIRVVSTTNS
nr:MAG TPA: Head fiber protein [Crassvirales sp.]